MTTTLTDHYPITVAYPQSLECPAEVTVTCPCGWTFESQESAGGGVEDWGPAWNDHTTDVEGDER